MIFLIDSSLFVSGCFFSLVRRNNGEAKSQPTEESYMITVVFEGKTLIFEMQTQKRIAKYSLIGFAIWLLFAEGDLLFGYFHSRDHYDFYNSN